MLENIKLVVWDLDNTLWNGIISEQRVVISDDIKKMLNNLVDGGVMNSICSKNDYDTIKKFLSTCGLWELFVFPSIDWSPKGERLNQLFSDMGLRSENVLFVDDSDQNLNEAKYYCQHIHVCNARNVDLIIAESERISKIDLNHKRLKQYKVLENKCIQKKNYSSNEDFLMESNIMVSINYECKEDIDRIAELVNRTNQLNYTKRRESKEELIFLLEDKSVVSGTVSVSDKYGDYGIAGFFAIKNGKAIHYLFSCRTLGMLIEQWVYTKIGNPIIDVQGEVVTELKPDYLPLWINTSVSTELRKQKRNEINKKILLKGPCDLSQIFSFIRKSKNIEAEFTIMSKDGYMIQESHSFATISTAITASKERINDIIEDARWISEEWFETDILNGEYQIIFLSTLAESSLGYLRRKSTGELIAHGDKHQPITNEKYWNKYVEKEFYDENIGYKLEEIKDFSEKYEAVDNFDFSLSMQCLKIIRDRIPQTTNLVLMLGSEFPCGRPRGVSYATRHLEHKMLNDMILEWASDKKNVWTINYTDFISGQNDYVNQIDHFQKRVYYEFAQRLVDIVGEITKEYTLLKVKNSSFLHKEETLDRIKPIARKILKLFRR